jgi:hypothetical protein
MKTAIAFERDQPNSPGRSISATGMQARYVREGCPPDFLERLHEKYILRAPQTGYPVFLRLEIQTRGAKEQKIIAAHFAYERGFGPRDHVYDRKAKTPAEEIANGKMALLTLNANLSTSMMDYSTMTGPGTSSLEAWTQAALDSGRGYVTLSTPSYVQLRKNVSMLVRRLSEKEMAERVAVGYLGGTMSYEEFALVGDRRSNIPRKFELLAKGDHGVKLGETRMIGFPEELSIVPTWSTINKKGQQKLKGNYMHREQKEKQYLTVIEFEDPNVRQTEEFDILRRYFAEHEQYKTQRMITGLGCPFIEVSREGEEPGIWRVTNFDVRDLKRQFDIEAMRTALEEDARLQAEAAARPGGRKRAAVAPEDDALKLKL